MIISNFIKKIYIIFFFCFLSLSNTYALSVIEESSGIKEQKVYVSFFSNSDGDVQNINHCDNDSYSTCDENEVLFSDSGIGSYSANDSVSGSNQDFISLFSSGNFTISSPGRIVIQFLLIDKADNVSVSQVEYRIDKNNPRLNLLSIIEDNITTFENGTTIYFRDGNENFKIVLDYDSGAGTYQASVPSRLELIPVSGSNNTENKIYPLSNEVEINTSDLSLNENSVGTYHLKIYDNSCTDPYVGEPYSGCNSIEIGTLTAVRDNTSPTLNFKFDDNSTNIYDETVSGGFSKFIEADNNINFNYEIKDLSGTLNSNNSGIKYKLEIEDVEIPESFTGFLDFDGISNVQTGIFNLDLSKVDNDLVSNGTYRLYNTRLTSNGEVVDKLCDNVNNCIPYDLTFRVISSKVDNDNSNFSYTGNDNKIFANNSDNYRVSYNLKDLYGNKVVPVYSIENNSIIRELTSKLFFTNGLFSDLRGNNGTGDLLSFYIDNENDNIGITGSRFGDEIVFNEDPLNQPDGKYDFSIKSKVPTHDLYPYVSDNTKLTLNSIGYDLDYIDNQELGYNLNDISKTEILNGTGEFVLNNGILPFENINDKYSLNFFDGVSNYGEIKYEGGINNSYYTFNNLIYNTKKPNFSFASPLVYGLKNFNVLIDGQWMNHEKELFNFSNITNGYYNVFEKHLATDGTIAKDINYEGGNIIFNYNLRKSTESGSGVIINNGVRFRATSNLDDQNFFNNNYIAYDMYDLLNNKENVSINQSTIDGVAYDTNNIKTGFVSFIKYIMNGDEVYLPSISRNISDLNGNPLDEYSMARNYYSDTYTLGDSNLSIISSISDIGISGLTNSNSNKITTDLGTEKANVNINKVGGDVTRYTLFTDFKRKISEYVGGFEPCNSKNISNLDELSSCTKIIKGEKVSYIIGNLTLNSDLLISEKRSIIIEGNLKINGNISTSGDGQLFLGVYSDGGLENVYDISNQTKTSDLFNSEKGWTFISDAPTNLDVFIVSQGPVISYNDSDKIFTKDNLDEYSLRNQLYIYGGLLSLNTIGGSRNETVQCPYIISGPDCDINVAQAFDLTFLRRFALVDVSNFNVNDLADPSIAGFDYESFGAPYHPNALGTAKMSGYNSDLTENNLRRIDIEEYKGLPLVIERDPSWTSSPSVFSIVK